MAHDQREAANKGWLGKPVAEAAPEAKTVGGDVVTFRNVAKSFTWKFEVPNHGRVELKAIAPADFDAPAVSVYVSRAESERS